MYSLVALLSFCVVSTFVVVFLQGRRGWLPAFARRWCCWPTPTTGGCSSRWARSRRSCRCGASSADRRALLRDAAIGYGVAALLYLPWVPTLLSQAKHTGAPWAEAPRFQDILNGLATVLGGAAPAMAFALAAGFGLSTLLARAAAVAAGARAALLVAIIAVTALALAFIASQISPAWSNRYFSVFVGPLLLLGAAGLARGGRLGLVVLAILFVFWFNPRTHALNTKSNAHTAAVLVRDRLEPGDMVVAAHPEYGPDMYYYLPKDIGLRWANIMGPVKDPQVFDWRNALARLRAAKPTPTADRADQHAAARPEDPPRSSRSSAPHGGARRGRRRSASAPRNGSACSIATSACRARWPCRSSRAVRCPRACARCCTSASSTRGERNRGPPRPPRGGLRHPRRTKSGPASAATSRPADPLRTVRDD